MASAPALDFLSLIVVMAANLFMIALALPLIMGREVSVAARQVQRSLLLQAVAWGAIIASTTAADRVLSTLSIALQAAAQWALYRALEEWLGPRPLRMTLLVMVMAAPVGYLLGFDHYAWRVGWSNFLLAASILIVARAVLYPHSQADHRWRYLLFACLLTSAGFTLARGLLGAFTDQYPSFRAPHPINLAAAIAVNVSLVLGTVALLVAWRSEAEGRLRTLAMTDSLTGLLNRRGFSAGGTSMLAHAWRHQLPLTALLLDLDHFKQINDHYGHDMGDRALQLFARLLRENCRSGDLAARWGGEEFGVLLLHNRPAAGQAFDLRLRQKLHAASEKELGFLLDFSCGMAELKTGETSLDELMSRADAAMYTAKQRGRGRLEVAG